ncbi:MAG TPA: hypothetical protein VF859_09895 [Burkholderiales bacterium]
MSVRVHTDDFDPGDLLRRAAPDIAHDLNNLRAIVQGNLRLVRQDAKSSSRQDLEEPLADVDMAFQLMVSQVQGVLALARGTPALAPAPQSVPGILRKVETLARWALPPQFRIAMPAKPPPIMVAADPELLQAAILRLVICAKDAAPGGGDLEICASAEVGQGVAETTDPSGAGIGRQVRICVEIPGSLPGADAAGESPAGARFALRFELALALARRAVAPAGDVLWGNKPAGRGFVCLLLPLGDS